MYRIWYCHRKTGELVYTDAVSDLNWALAVAEDGNDHRWTVRFFVIYEG